MRLAEDSSYSWKSNGIKRRMYRQAPLTPEQESIKRSSDSKKYKKKKHAHTYVRRVLGTEIVRRHVLVFNGGGYEIREYEQPKSIMVCTGCGNKRRW